MSIHVFATRRKIIMSLFKYIYIYIYIVNLYNDIHLSFFLWTISWSFRGCTEYLSVCPIEHIRIYIFVWHSALCLPYLRRSLLCVIHLFRLYTVYVNDARCILFLFCSKLFLVFCIQQHFIALVLNSDQEQHTSRIHRFA